MMSRSLSNGANRTFDDILDNMNTKVCGLAALRKRFGDAEVLQIIREHIDAKKFIVEQRNFDETTMLFMIMANSLAAPPHTIEELEPPDDSEEGMKICNHPWKHHSDCQGSDDRVYFFDPTLKIGLPKKGEKWPGQLDLISTGLKAAERTAEFPENDHNKTSQNGAIKSNLDILRSMASGMAMLGDKLPTPNIVHDELDSDAMQSQIAFHGPGVLFLKPSENKSLGKYVSDVMALTGFEVRSGFEKLGGAAYFDDKQRLTAVVTAKGSFKPGDELWEHAKYVWRCSAMTCMTSWHHLTWTHWIVSNGFTSSVRVLPEAHPVRRALKVNCYGTAQINTNSTVALYPEHAFLHKLSPFKYTELQKIFYASADAYKFQTWPDYVASSPLDDGLKKQLPFFADGLRAWAVIKKFMVAYVDLYFESDAAVLEDTHLQEYWKFSLVPQYSQGLPALSKSSLADQMTHSAFMVTAWHEFVGGLMPYLSSPDGMFYSVRETEPPQVRADLHHYIGSFCLTSATGGRMPYYARDWGHLLLDDNARKLQASLVAELGEVSKQVMNSSKFRDFDPLLWECSVSV